MARQLDILALEPFYGGVRRAMLGALVKCSRHRWTLLKLPPRKMERRLSASANWFAEQLLQHFSGHIDVLFTSEAMNLANLLRLVPDLTSRPSVVYFHDNHLPEVDSTLHGPFDAINLTTASAATESWFNSDYHLKSFLARGAALVARLPELADRNPMPAITAKARLVPPPLDLSYVSRTGLGASVTRDPRAIFVETRDAQLPLLNAALDLLNGRGREFRLITVGPVELLSDDWPRHPVKEMDEAAQVLGMLESAVFVSAKPAASSDYLCVRAVLAGCRAVVPAAGVYPEMLKGAEQFVNFYEPTPADLAAKLQSAIDADTSRANQPDWRRALKALDAVSSCRQIDERIEQLAVSQKSARMTG